VLRELACSKELLPGNNDLRLSKEEDTTVCKI
jgi:hypothetical protein